MLKVQEKREYLFFGILREIYTSRALMKSIILLMFHLLIKLGSNIESNVDIKKIPEIFYIKINHFKI